VLTEKEAAAAYKEGYNHCVFISDKVSAISEALSIIKQQKLLTESDYRLIGKLEATIYHLENY
jgi:hypothetical protein